MTAVLDEINLARYGEHFQVFMTWEAPPAWWAITFLPDAEPVRVKPEFARNYTVETFETLDAAEHRVAELIATYWHVKR